MFKFKKKEKEPVVIEKTITIRDSQTQEIEDVIVITDIDPEIEEIILEDNIGAGMIPALTDIEMKDMTMMKSLRDMYPDQEDMESFVMDACKAHKVTVDAANKELQDKIAKEKAKIDALIDGKTEKELHDIAMKELNKKQVDREKRATEIEEAERKRHAAAQAK